jgi:uncharacterized protein YdaU (DUF1376 family)
MHYYQFNIGDYKSHTNHLDLLEDLAYRRLLDLYYLHERPLNSGITAVARQIGMRDHETEVKTVLEEFFDLTDDGWINQRADKEIKHFHSKIDQASRAGKASAERRMSARSTDVQLTNNQEPITNNQINTYICPPDGELEAMAASKIPACQHQGVIELYHQHLPTLRRVEVWNATRQGYLRQRWREVAEELAQEKPIEISNVLNWWSDFFQHIGKSKFLTGKVNSKDGRAFTADLEWILKPTNFAKIVEGKYHGNN